MVDNIQSVVRIKLEHLVSFGSLTLIGIHRDVVVLCNKGVGRGIAVFENSPVRTLRVPLADILVHSPPINRQTLLLVLALLVRSCKENTDGAVGKYVAHQTGNFRSY